MNQCSSDKQTIFYTRPLNPRHFPSVGEPAYRSGFPILGEFEFRTPQNWGAGGPSAIMTGLTEAYWDRFYITNRDQVDFYQVLRILKHLGRVVPQ
jgi:hypothetical protein